MRAYTVGLIGRFYCILLPLVKFLGMLIEVDCGQTPVTVTNDMCVVDSCSRSIFLQLT